MARHQVVRELTNLEEVNAILRAPGNSACIMQNFLTGAGEGDDPHMVYIVSAFEGDEETQDSDPVRETEG